MPTGESIDDFSILLDAFIDMIITSDISEKTVVHCSAGIGRTGTTISLMQLIISICSQINAGIKDPKFSVFATVRRLREQRLGMVQMPEQYMFIYQFLAYWLKQN